MSEWKNEGFGQDIVNCLYPAMTGVEMVCVNYIETIKPRQLEPSNYIVWRAEDKNCKLQICCKI